ncbi:MAG: glycosyltransferase family 2 protein, partial [Bacteroides sp.]|nr:glycosyltransferase family 2 protein [Bacteroides sp.]
MNKMNCFIPFVGAAQAEKTVKSLQETGLVERIYLLALPGVEESLSGVGEGLPDVAEDLPGCST